MRGRPRKVNVKVAEKCGKPSSGATAEFGNKLGDDTSICQPAAWLGKPIGVEEGVVGRQLVVDERDVRRGATGNCGGGECLKMSTG